MSDDLAAWVERFAWLREQFDWQEDIALRAQTADRDADRLFEGHCSPSWTLGDVAAKRRILAEMEFELREAYSGTRDTGDGHGLSCTVVELLMLPYADRPGYREEWRR